MLSVLLILIHQMVKYFSACTKILLTDCRKFEDFCVAGKELFLVQNSIYTT